MLSGSRDIRLYDSNNNLSGYSAPGAGEDHYRSKVFDFEDPKKKHLLRYENSPMYVQDVYAYDDYGNMTSHKRQDTTPTTAIRSTTAYSEDGNRMLSQTDPRGLTMSYEYNSNGTVKKATMPNGQAVSYEYDAQKRVTETQATNESGTYKNTYSYENDRLKTVSHNTTGTEQDVTYTFEYDAFGKPTTVKVGSQVLGENQYDSDRQQKLRKVVYGNGQYSENNYDEFGRLIATRSGKSGEAAPTAWDYEYSHAANGQVAKMKDNVLGRVVWTEFDEANRPKKSTTQDEVSGELIYQTTLGYNDQEHVSSLKENVAGTTYTTTYTYDWDDRATEVRYGSTSQRVRYTYDGQGRLYKRRVNNGNADHTATFSYLASEVGVPGLSTPTSTNLVSSISQPGVSFSYGYAENTNNIVSETRTGGSYAGTTTYEYDSIGQLKRVNSPTENATWVYTYDLGGNILNKKKYAYTTGEPGEVQQTISYTYGDANWKDKLTAYDGQTLTYDAIGNLTSDGTWTYTWTRGRQLAGMSKPDGSVSISYEYNAAGLRTKKTVNGVETKYTLNGKQVVHMTRGSDWMHFYYDAQGKPSIVNYNSAMYHYLYNLQGDVIGLLDNSSNIVVEYNYDAWGKLLAVTGALSSTLGWLNPFRYRGYIYDEETGLYYLRSRYYNSKRGRFINADALIGKSSKLLTHNIYAYCGDAPISRCDSLGLSWADFCQWAETVWDNIAGWFQRNIGFEAALTSTVTTAKTPEFDYWIVSGEAGIEHTTTLKKVGDAAKPVSFYVSKDTSSIVDVMIGVKLGPITFEICVAPDDIGFYCSYIEDNVTHTDGLSINLKELQIGVKDSISEPLPDSETTKTSYATGHFNVKPIAFAMVTVVSATQMGNGAPALHHAALGY